jgi:predicted lipoprotein with Yx(FWY)xxD motif
VACASTESSGDRQHLLQAKDTRLDRTVAIKQEICVQNFPALLAGSSAGKWQVSATGSINPQWRRDGKELFYLTPDKRLMAVEVKFPGSALQ